MNTQHYPNHDRAMATPKGQKTQVLRGVVLLLGTLCWLTTSISAQCSICTKTASQLGEGPASALNSAILYLAAAPLAIMGFIGWRWWKNEKSIRE